MATWINFSSGQSARNGTTGHTLTVDQPAENSFLVLLVSSPSPPAAAPSGWAQEVTAVSNGGITAFTKIAAGTETSIPLTLNHSNFAVEYALMEFYEGTAWGGDASQNEASNPGPTLAGIADVDPTVVFVQGFGVHGTPVAEPNPYVDDPAGFTRIYQHYIPVAATDGSGICIHAADTWDAGVAPSIAFTSFIVNDTGISGAIAQARIAFWLNVAAVEILDTPVVTVDSTSNPTTEGGVDGSITVSWPAVTGAGTYTAEIADGHNATTGFTVDDAAATSPHTYNGLGAGQYTVAITAVPPEA
jgi:hypothetical protein